MVRRFSDGERAIMATITSRWRASKHAAHVTLFTRDALV